MTLKASKLSEDIEKVLKSQSAVASENTSAPSDNGAATNAINSSIKTLADGIAKAVVDHIVNNLEVTCDGKGYSGFQVVAKSNNPLGSIK